MTDATAEDESSLLTHVLMPVATETDARATATPLAPYRPEHVTDTGETSKQEVGEDFEPVTVEGVQPCEGSIVTRRPVGVFTRFPNRGLVDASQDDDEQDVARSRGLPSTPGNGSSPMTSAATSFTSDAER